jgi:cytochrome P450
MGFFLAGHEYFIGNARTTSNSLTFCINQIARHPEVQQKILNEINSIGEDVTDSNLSQFKYTILILDTLSGLSR